MSALDSFDSDSIDIEINNLKNQSTEYVYLNLDRFVRLKNLFCSGSNIKSIVSVPSSLTQLYCRKNYIEDLGNLTNCLDLFLIDCGHNALTKLDGLPQGLKYLSCESNDLIELSNLPTSLIRLNCSNNKITSLDHLPCSLTILKTNLNEIITYTNLPIELEILQCDDLDLESLNMLPKSLKILRLNTDTSNTSSEKINLINEYCKKNNVSNNFGYILDKYET